MWAVLDYSTFPIINVKFNKNIKNTKDFNDFLEDWMDLYRKEYYFEFVFHTKKCEFINPIYCIYMASFIKKLKKEKIQYLKKTTIYVYNIYVLYLLKIIFQIEKPVAPVHIIYINQSNIEDYEIIYP